MVGSSRYLKILNGFDRVNYSSMFYLNEEGRAIYCRVKIKELSLRDLLSYKIYLQWNSLSVDVVNSNSREVQTSIHLCH